ncbi:MAG TPA: DEDD exonuclease domain-containing protein [Acidimicrobiia bacterium]|nr:DEDD exonuclease domain-containing protein [Acidimicrobiia bacterium]
MPALLQPSFDDLSTPLFDVTFCVLDLETTGGSPRDCAITEIGAVKYRGGDLLGTFQTLVDPGLPIPPLITILTGITEAMVVEAPDIATALPTFLEFIGDAVIVGHNIRFDISFLNAAAALHGYPPLGNDTVDTAGLGRRLVRDEVRNLRLQTLAAHFRSPVTPIHRALDDARATAHVLHGLLERAGSLGVTNLDDLLQLPRARGSAYYSKIALTEALPRQPGVYLFRDRHGTPIYVGKATNLRARVRQYFYGDERRTIGNLMRELHAVDHIVCPTPLEAEITELRLIHTYRPRYNRRSRPPKSSHWVKLTSEPFPRLSVVRTLKTKGRAHLGPFRSKTAADLVVSALWDATMIRRCSSRPGSRSARCAPAQMGVALCPCDGSLDPFEYQREVDQIVEGITHRSDLLLEPLVDRMEQLSSEQRYEEAGWVRDRHEALARAIETSRTWAALEGLGVCELEGEDGSHVVVDHGRLVCTWRTGSNPPLRPAPEASDAAGNDVPDSVETAEEARLIWNWIKSTPLRLVDATGTLALPMRPVVHLGPRSRR